MVTVVEDEAHDEEAWHFDQCPIGWLRSVRGEIEDAASVVNSHGGSSYRGSDVSDMKNPWVSQYCV